MSLAPTTVKYLVMGLLSMGWLVLCHHAMRLSENQPFHIATYHRDCRKARFYFLSVWIGLGVAFLSFLCLEALTGLTFETATLRDWVLGTARGAGMWGLLVAVLVWTQVGQRVSQPNSDGASLLPFPEERRDKK